MVSLKKYERLLEGWAKKRTAYYERELRKVYQQALKDVMGEVGGVYSKWEDSGKLHRSDLMKFRRLQKFQSAIFGHIDTLSKRKQKVFYDMINESSEYSYDWMCWAIESEAQLIFKKKKKFDAEHDVSFADQKKRMRADIRRMMQSELKEGVTYQAMARQFDHILTGDEKRMNRTMWDALHKMVESGKHEAAVDANIGGIVMTKKWLSKRDDRVRTVHQSLDGERLQIEEYFDVFGHKALMPKGFIGVIELNINCRCKLTYDIERTITKRDEKYARKGFKEWRLWKRHQADGIET